MIVQVNDMIPMTEVYRIEAIKIMTKMLKYSKFEYERYEKTRNEIYLQQAGEKLFNAYSKYLEIKFSKRTQNHDDTRKLAYHDEYDTNIMSNLDHLHEYFYHGGDVFSTNQYYTSALKKVEDAITIYNKTGIAY